MKEVTEIFIATVLLFGALVFWPAMKFWVKIEAKYVLRFKKQFWFHVIGLIAGFSLVQYYYFIGNKDWLHTLIVPYGVGLLSWVMALIILSTFIFMKMSKRKYN